MKAVLYVSIHPFYKNYFHVMLETGNIHLVEATNGSIYFEDVAIVQPNSYWACDPTNYQMLVVADNGLASLFDISFGC